MSGYETSIDALKRLEAEALEAAAAARDVKSLEALRVLYLGRKEGKISLALRGLGKLSPAERPAPGSRGQPGEGVGPEGS
jgi:phenylalanyl-tRNA synthetase alpha chain